MSFDRFVTRWVLPAMLLSWAADLWVETHLMGGGGG
jgi:hypothetical protein